MADSFQSLYACSITLFSPVNFYPLKDKNDIMIFVALVAKNDYEQTQI